MRPKHLKLTGGFSLIEAMVASTLIAISVVAMSTFVAHQQQEIARLNTKLALLDVGNDARGVLSDPARCIAAFAGTRINTAGIPTAGAPLHNSLITLPSLREISGAFNRVLVAVTAPIGGVSQTTVSGIEVTDWLSNAADEFRASLVISLAQNGGPVKPMTITGLKFKTDPASPPGSKTITDCRLTSDASVAMSDAHFCEDLLGGVLEDGACQLPYEPPATQVVYRQSTGSNIKVCTRKKGKGVPPYISVTGQCG